MNTFNLTLDLNKSRAANPVRIRQGDVQGTTITALILDHGATADLTGYTAQFVMDLPDGTHYYRKAASISGNTVTVTIDETQAASVTGRTTLAYVQLLKGSTVKASTGCVTVEVLPDALDGKSVPESYDSAIQDAIDALDDAVEQMPDMVEDVLADHPEWTTTVQDGSITQAKLATDLARDRERLLYRLDNLLTAQLPEGETATATDAAKTPVAGLALYGRSTQASTPTPSAPVPIVSVQPDSEGNISLWARGRNLLQPQQAGTFGGVTFTVNEDGSVTLNGTATTTINQFVQFVVPETGAYTLSGCPAGGGSSKYQLWTYDTSEPRDPQITDVGSGGTGTLTKGHVINVRLRIQSGYACSNLTFYPQLEAGTTATAYQPYEQTVTPIPLDGHVLRSLPDGTRDELTVDARGHAVLVQRVGSVTLDGSESWVANNSWYGFRISGFAESHNAAYTNAGGTNTMATHGKGVGGKTAFNASLGSVNIGTGDMSFNQNGSTGGNVSTFKTWLAANPVTLMFALATPVTHDLGTVDPVPLVGPDLTAQAVPTAPFALAYERDLNATLARLESAIATLA